MPTCGGQGITNQRVPSPAWAGHRQAVGRQQVVDKQPAEALIRRWLKQRDPNFTAAEVDEHVRLVKRELAQL